MENKSSILERLKICWNVLTKKNYVYFGIKDEPIKWNENGEYDGIVDGALLCYTYITEDYKFTTNNGETNLHDFTWGVISKFAQNMQEGKYK